MSQIIKKSFKDWTQDHLRFLMGVTKTLKPLPAIKEWEKIAKGISLTKEEEGILKKLRDIADDDIDGWNETELRENFIIEVLKTVNFRLKEHDANKFSERYISTRVGRIQMQGYVDWMVARGTNQPIEPYFFIHEFKHEEGGTNDARGQLVAAMLAAQQLNKKPPLIDEQGNETKHYYKTMPIYGTYIIGRMWFFVVLEGKQFYVAPVCIATKIEDLHLILKMLKAQKMMIIERLTKETIKLDNLLVA